MKTVLKYMAIAISLAFFPLSAHEEIDATYATQELDIAQAVRSNIELWYYKLKALNPQEALVQLKLCLNTFFAATQKQEASEQLRIALHELIANCLQIEVHGHSKQNWEKLVQRLQLLKNKAAYADYHWYMIQLQLDQAENIATSDFSAETSRFRAEIMSAYLAHKKIGKNALSALETLLSDGSERLIVARTALSKFIEQNKDPKNSAFHSAFQGLIDKEIFIKGYQTILFHLLAGYSTLGTIDATFDAEFQIHLALERLFYAYLYELYCTETGEIAIAISLEVPEQFNALRVTELPQPLTDLDSAEILALQTALTQGAN